MNNTYHTLHIDETMTRSSILKAIKSALDANPGVIMIDMLEVSFPLHRDFFLVLSRKFPSDRYILRLKSQKTVTMAQSMGLQAEVAGVKMEFDRTYSDSNIATHNMTMWEYFLYELRRGFAWCKFILFERNKKEPKLPHFKKNNSQTILILMGLVASCVLLLFIFHFAISKTIITISPEITVRPISANILFRSDNASGSVLENRNVLRLKKISLPIERSMKFKVTSIDPASAQNAKGVVTIYNALTVPQELRPNTRFVTADGLVFRTNDWVKIPQSRSLNGITEIGLVETEVTADVNDESGKITGARGNIAAGTDLSIPGLKFNRDRVYAKAKTEFFGGADPNVYVLTKEELASFEKTLKERLEKEGKGALEEKLNSDLKTIGEDFALFVVDTLKYNDISFEITSGQKVGDVANEIELKVKANISAVVMDKKGTIEYLTNKFRENLLHGTSKELGIHPDTLRVTNVPERGKDDEFMKLTLEMNTSTTYDLENESNELTRRLKGIITGLPEDEAKQKMIEEGYVKDVEIQNYPFWVNSISNNPYNIEFVIKK